MRQLVFTGREGLEFFDAADGWEIISCAYPADQRAETLARFLRYPDSKLAVDRCMALGWRAPEGTAILFHPSWRHAWDSPYTLQAISRVAISPDALAKL